MSENLKLPICPKCHDTAHVKTSDFFGKEYVWNTAFYHCNSCNIDWKFGVGISSTDKGQQDSGINIFSDLNERINKPIEWCGWSEIGIGILDNRCLKDV
jgi:hypothetical protein